MKKYLLFIGLYLFGLSSLCKVIACDKNSGDFYTFIHADFGHFFWVLWIISIIMIVSGLALYLCDVIKEHKCK